MEKAKEGVRQTLERFKQGYLTRDLEQIDAFMELFAQSDDIELIGIGAAVRGGTEWFQGRQQVREIIESDWEFWGDVIIDTENVKISVVGEAAWLTTSGSLEQNQSFEKALPFYLEQMKEFLEDEASDAASRMMEATHYGMRRIREKAKGLGYCWPFVLSAMLVKTGDQWRFHTIHWSMPVD